MAVVDIDPLVLKNVELTIDGADDFRKHVDAVTFTPTTSSITWTGLGENTYTDVATATWTVVLNYAQDWKSANSLSQYLYMHEGETVPMVFTPRDGESGSFAADVIIAPGAIGGTVNAYAVTSVTLGCKEKPVFTPVAPADGGVQEAAESDLTF